MSRHGPDDSVVRAEGLRFAVLAARYNVQVVEPMREAASSLLRDRGAALVEEIFVPGAFELPLAAQAAARSGRFDAVVAIGAVIRGETAHFDYVAGECARGLARVMLDTGIPVGFGVITTEDLAQAQARAGGDAGNKGEEAARAALELAHVVRSLDRSRR